MVPITLVCVSTCCKETGASLRHATLIRVLSPGLIHSVTAYDVALDLRISYKIHDVALPHWAAYLTLTPCCQ